jgi:membrane protein
MLIKGKERPLFPLVQGLAGRVVRGIMKDNCDGYAAQIAFFFLFALFPFLLSLITLLAYLPVPGLIGMLLRIIGPFAPDDVLYLVEKNLRILFSVHQGGLLSIGILLTLWTASNAVISIQTALNAAFEIQEQRPYWKVRMMAGLLVISFTFFIIVSLLLLFFGPRIGFWIVSLAGFGTVFSHAWNILRWLLIFSLMAMTLSALYRFAPTVRLSWHETAPGAITATVAWVAVSLAFSFFVNKFETYNKTYGSIGTVIALLVWMYASGYVILIGGEINAGLRELLSEKAGRTKTREE